MSPQKHFCGLIAAQTRIQVSQVVGPHGPTTVVPSALVRLVENLADLLVESIDELPVGPKTGVAVVLFHTGGDDKGGV